MTGGPPPPGGHWGGGPPPGPYGPYQPPPRPQGPYGPPQSPYPPGAYPPRPSQQTPPPGPPPPPSPYGRPAPAGQPYGRPLEERPPPWERQLDQPPPWEQAPQPSGPPPGEPQPPGQTTPGTTRQRRRRLSPTARRLVEAGALLLLLPTTLGLHWYDDDQTLGRRLHRDEHITTVARGASGTLGHASWRMIGRQVGGAQGLRSSAAGTGVLVLALEVRPLDAQGVKNTSGSRLTFRVRDREGHIWTGEGEVPDTLQVGRPARVRVSAIVPSGKVTSVVLELLPSTYQVQPGAVVPVLRFGH
jgi:hypothetical protein